MGISKVIFNRAVFLDRDGVLNRPVVTDGKPFPPSTVNEFELYSDAKDSCLRLKKAGYLLVVVTNQPDVARGTQDINVVEEMHQLLARQLPIDRVMVCCHDDADACECRKPKSGMLLKVADELRINLKESFMVGDRWRDIEAGSNAGCRTVFIQRNYDEQLLVQPDAVVYSIGQAADWITLGQMTN
jgi:D-glycero-D-manno-heptose 1,7-bisphosphate phosphatase